MYRRKRRSEEGVSLNVTAMLDMAFQLLAFFLLTFKPNVIEQSVQLRLPPEEALAKPQNQAQQNKGPSAIEQVLVTVGSNPEGKSIVAMEAVGGPFFS